MSRISLLLLLLLAPSMLGAQTPTRGQGNRPLAGATEAEIFIQAFQVIRSYALEATGDSILWEKAIEGLIEGLGDPYAAVFTPSEVEQFDEDTTGNYAGIGIQISELNNAVTVTAVFRGTPAERAGILVGDRIFAVDEESAQGWTTEDVSRRVRGRAGTMVTVAVQREGIPEPVVHRIRRDQVHVSSVVAGRLFNDLGYIALDRVAENSAAEVDSALVLLRDTKGIIFDLRQNPGGLLEESLHLADLFLDRGERLAAVKGRVPGQALPVEEAWTARTSARIPGKPVIILVDRFTASAAEIIAGALQDHDRALVIGERTFGKGVVQSVLPLPGGRRIRLTTGEWYTPLGRGLHRPRDREGQPLTEELDTVATVRSSGGRALKAGGGIFPDLVLADDTLKTVEREFLAESARAQFPLALRLQELAFDASRSAAPGTPAATGIPNSLVTGLLAEIREKGVQPGLSDSPEVADYLRWRLEFTYEQRRGEDGKAAEVRARRDRILREAARLLQGASTQADLYPAAARLGASLEADAPVESEAEEGAESGVDGESAGEAGIR